MILDKKQKKAWHEKEIPVKITSKATQAGVRISVSSEQLSTSLALRYPRPYWHTFHKNNKVKFLENIAYIFTAHLPFLLKGNIRLEYNTGYPAVYSWANHCFMRFLPAYWFMQGNRRGTKVFPLLKTILNSQAIFQPVADIPPSFPETYQKRAVIPFTFGKDSFLTYYLAKEIGLKTTLVYFNEPTELFTKDHKLDLINQFKKTTGEEVIFIDNPLGTLREYGEGWFGWELALTSWALLALPIAYQQKAAYILFSNERSVNNFFYDEEGFRVNPDYDQSSQGLKDLSIQIQSLSEGEVYVSTFLQGLEDLAIIGILKLHFQNPTFHLLMSCWAETKAAENNRWCGECTKCARLYVYMTANGINPLKDVGFRESMLTKNKQPLFNVFEKKATGTGWDAFGLNTEEQALAFYLTYLRGNRDPLIIEFSKTPLFQKVKKEFKKLVKHYYGLHPEDSTPIQWKPKIDTFLNSSLFKVRKQLSRLHQTP